MNSSCSIDIFDQGPSHIPWTICKSNLSFQTTVLEHYSGFWPTVRQDTCGLSQYYLLAVLWSSEALTLSALFELRPVADYDY